VGTQRDAAVAGDDQAEPDQTKIGAFLFRPAALCDRGTGVGGVDVGRQVRHVQHQRGQIQPELGDHSSTNTSFDLDQHVGVDGVHCRPESAVIQRRLGHWYPSIPSGGCPPIGETEFRARSNNPVQRRETDVGPNRNRSIRTAGADHVVDDAGYIKALQHRPHCCDITETEMTGAFRHPHRAVHRGFDIGCFTQVALGDDLRFPVDPGHLAQVKVGLSVDHLAND